MFHFAYLDQEFGIRGFQNKSSQLGLLKSRFGIYSTIVYGFRNHFANILLYICKQYSATKFIFICGIFSSSIMNNNKKNEFINFFVDLNEMIIFIA